MSESKHKKIDYLNEDTPIPNQAWVCISFLSPEGIKNCKIRGLKIRGVYATKQEADDRAKDLQKMDADFHVFVGEVGKWLPWDPNPDSVTDNVYREDELNKLMKGYKENLVKAKQMEEERRKQMISESMNNEKARQNAKAKKLRKKLKKKGKDVEVRDEELNEQMKDEELADDNTVVPYENKQLEAVSSEIKQDEESLKQITEKLQEKQKLLKESTQNMRSIDDNLAKIQELYSKLTKKKEGKN